MLALFFTFLSVVNLQENLKVKNLFKWRSSYLEKHTQKNLLCCKFLEEFSSVNKITNKLVNCFHVCSSGFLLSLKTHLGKDHAWLMLCCPKYSCLVQRTMALSVPNLDLSHHSDPATYPSLTQFLPMYPGFLEWRVVVSTGPEGKGGRMRGRGEAWILQLGCKTSKVFSPSLYFIKRNEISCIAAVLGGVNCVWRGGVCVPFSSS